MVLEDRSHGPMLCLGVVALSLPPHCGDVPVKGWSWDAVEGEESMSGTRWGQYHVVGRYDGKTFEVIQVGRYEDDSHWPEVDFTSPCDEPPGGWPELDGATQEEAHRVHAYARSQPDYVTSWVTHLKPEAFEFSPVVVNVMFTGSAARHEAEIEQLWDGPLCVVERPGHSARDLKRIRTEAEQGLAALGLQMLWSEGPSVDPRIDIGVVADQGGKGQASLDTRFGAGVIRLIPALKPYRD
jgi:hypothetical protein